LLFILFLLQELEKDEEWVEPRLKVIHVDENVIRIDSPRKTATNEISRFMMEKLTDNRFKRFERMFIGRQLFRAEPSVYMFAR